MRVEKYPIRIIEGNSFTLSIELQQIAWGHGTGTISEFVPLESDRIRVWLVSKSSERIEAFNAVISANELLISFDEGICKGLYDIEIFVYRANGTRLHCRLEKRIHIVPTTDKMGIEVDTIQLTGAVLLVIDGVSLQWDDTPTIGSGAVVTSNGIAEAFNNFIGNDREYNSQENTKGYVILRNDKTLAEQLTKENTIYEVCHKYDLGGKVSDDSYSLNNIELSSSSGSYWYLSEIITIQPGECFVKWDEDTYFVKPNEISRIAGLKHYISAKDTAVSFRIGRSDSLNTQTFDSVYGEIWKCLTIPSGCVLKFNGGCISNGAIITNNMTIDAPCVKIFDNTKLLGTVSNAEYNVTWSGIVDYHFTVLYEGDNKELVDCSEIIHETLFGLNNILRFGDGQFFFKELHVTWNHLYIVGNTNEHEARTYFIPYYESGQRYVIKVGGRKDVFNDDNNGKIGTISVTNIIGIAFASSVSSVLGNGSVFQPRHMMDLPDVNNEPGYHGGYLCIDNCNAGNISIRGISTRDVPTISIGVGYEFHYGYIIDYGHLGKSDCPVINFAGREGAILSATRMDMVQCEGITGPVIGVANKHQIIELEITYFNFEQSIFWRSSGYVATTSEDRQYFLKNRGDKISELLAVENNQTVIKRVPIFDLANAVIHIVTARISNCAERWVNLVDDNPEQKVCESFISAKGNVNLHIDMLEAHDFAFFMLDSKVSSVSSLYIDTMYSQLSLKRDGNEVNYNDIYTDGEAIIALPYLLQDPTSLSKFYIDVKSPTIPYLGVVNEIKKDDCLNGVKLYNIMPPQSRYSLTASALNMQKDNGKDVVLIRHNIARFIPYPIRVETSMDMAIEMRLYTNDATKNGIYRVELDYYSELTDISPLFTDTQDVEIKTSYTINTLHIVPNNGANFVVIKRVDSNDTKTWSGINIALNSIKTKELTLVSDIGTPLFYDAQNKTFVNTDNVDITNVTSIKGKRGERQALSEQLTSVNAGLRFYDKAFKRYALWDGTRFVRDGNVPFEAPDMGVSSLRPSDVPNGYIYLDLTLNRFIFRKNSYKITKYTFTDITSALTPQTITFVSGSGANVKVKIKSNEQIDTFDKFKEKVLNVFALAFSLSSMNYYFTGFDFYIYSSSYFRSVTSDIEEGAYLPTSEENIDIVGKWVEADGATAGVNRIGTSSQRPTSSNIYNNFQYYDTTLNKFIMWNGSDWVNLDGTSLT